LLRQAGKRIELAHDADDRLAAAVFGNERRGDSADIARDVESVRCCVFDQGVCGFILPESDFGMAPNAVAEVNQCFGLRIDRRNNVLFQLPARVVLSRGDGSD